MVFGNLGSKQGVEWTSGLADRVLRTPYFGLDFPRKLPRFVAAFVIGLCLRSALSAPRSRVWPWDHIV